MEPNEASVMRVYFRAGELFQRNNIIKILRLHVENLFVTMQSLPI